MSIACAGNKFESLLYVEDDENDALFMQMAYKGAGVPQPLKIVSDGQKAIDYLMGVGSFGCREENPLPCVVLLDLKLPIKNGFEVLRWIRAQEEFKTLPVVIYSASTLEQDRELATNLGANGYWVKALSKRGIVEMLKQIKERWLMGETRAA